MDSNGKIIMARHNEVSQTNVGKVEGEVVDGEPMTLAVKDLGSCEIYPQTLRHNPNGRYVSAGRWDLAHFT
jgi:coatomer subunit beta'